MLENNIVLIGKKPPMNYVLAVLTLYQNGSNEIILKARGNAISKAVDVSEITTKRFVPELSVKKIEIGTEQLKSPDTGAINNVSSMEIHIGK